MNGPTLLALATHNQPVVAALLHTVDLAIQADPKVLADVFRVVDGSLTLLGFAKSHPALVANLTGILVAHPELFAELVAAVEG